MTITPRQKELLSKIPGDYGIPFMGDFFSYIKDPLALFETKKAKYGEIYKSQFFGRKGVTLLGKEANKFLLVEQAKYFSNEKGWEFPLAELFPNGLMLMDGERHQYHRSILRTAFEKEPMQGYLDLMLPIIDNYIKNWSKKNRVIAFNEMKELTLQVAGKVFFGLDFSEDLAQVNRDLVLIVKASTALPVPIPFGGYWKGLRARKRLENYFKKIILKIRKSPQTDLFSILCLAENEDGAKLTDQEIIDHVIFILMASHDTTASTLTSLLYLLAKKPDWQEKLRKECSDFGYENFNNLKDLRKLELMGLTIKEALRMYPPLINVPRYANEETQFGGYTLPAGLQIMVVLQHNHYNNQIWESPEKFDPTRFAKDRKEHQKCPHAYAPFGAGKHHCLGFAFAEMEIKLILGRILQEFKWSVKPDYIAPYNPIPLQEPKDGLPIKIEKS